MTQFIDFIEILCKSMVAEGCQRDIFDKKNNKKISINKKIKFLQ